MKQILSLMFLLAATTGNCAEDARVKWLARNGKDAHTQYTYAGKVDGRGLWVATDDNPGGYDVMHEFMRTNDDIKLKSTKYSGLTITLTEGEAFHSVDDKPVHRVEGGWNERIGGGLSQPRPKQPSVPKNPPKPSTPKGSLSYEYVDNSDLHGTSSVYVRNRSERSILFTITRKSEGFSSGESTNQYSILPGAREYVGATHSWVGGYTRYQYLITAAEFN